MIRGWAGLGVAGVALWLLVAAGCGGSSPSTPLGTVADSGFRTPINGLPFQNYGAELSTGAVPVNLTAADVQKLFGDGVCADAQLRRCDLIPEAQAWLNDTNQAMSGGHCYGFSVLSELVWQGKVNVNTLGAAAATGLAIDNNQTLQRTIAYDWALQTLQSVQAERITGSPDQILDKLRQVLKPHPSQTYTIALWKRDGSGGHAVTPPPAPRPPPSPSASPTTGPTTPSNSLVSPTSPVAPSTWAFPPKAAASTNQGMPLVITHNGQESSQTLTKQ